MLMTDAQFAQLERYEAEWVARERQLEPDPDLWRWSPTPLPKVRSMMATADMCSEIIQLDHLPRFFDAGCGIGTKLALAEQEFVWDAEGWDYYLEYVQFARNVLKVKAHQFDLRSSEPDWASYDIVMISRPFKDDDEQHAWEQKVQDTMRPGAVLLATHAALKPYRWRWLYRAPWRIVAVKPVDPSEDHTQANVPGAIVRQP
jgi:SAM-dependent methyltransferase